MPVTQESFDEQFSLIYEELRRLTSGVLCSKQNCRLMPTSSVSGAILAFSENGSIRSSFHYTAHLHGRPRATVRSGNAHLV
jgi:hypothetical protein